MNDLTNKIQMDAMEFGNLAYATIGDRAGEHKVYVGAQLEWCELLLSKDDKGVEVRDYKYVGDLAICRRLEQKYIETKFKKFDMNVLKHRASLQNK